MKHSVWLYVFLWLAVTLALAAIVAATGDVYLP